MTKHLDVAGTTYADIVVWRWERPGMRWVSRLRDGTELVVALQRFGHQTFWNPSIDGKALPSDGLRDPESAQKVAFAAWERRQSRKLTKAQLDELKCLARAPQPSYGKGRVRVHNNLRRLGLALIEHHSGFICSITQKGRDFLRALET